MERNMGVRKSAVLQNSRHTVDLSGSALIEIYGESRVLIENHQGVIGYGCEEILVKVRNGCVRIGGEHLKLSKMCKEKLVVTGKIRAVELQGRG